MKKYKILRLLPLLVSNFSQGQITQYEFHAEITGLASVYNDMEPSWDSSVHVGQSATLSFAIDTASSDLDSRPEVSQYLVSAIEIQAGDNFIIFRDAYFYIFNDFLDVFTPEVLMDGWSFDETVAFTLGFPPDVRFLSASFGTTNTQYITAASLYEIPAVAADFDRYNEIYFQTELGRDGMSLKLISLEIAIIPEPNGYVAFISIPVVIAVVFRRKHRTGNQNRLTRR